VGATDTTTLSDERVAAILRGAEAKARELGVPSSVAVVDNHGNLRAFVRQEAAVLVTIAAAQRKAYTAAASGLATDQWQAMGGGDMGFFTAAASGFPGWLMLGGGVPIMVGGTLVGAVGVSGGQPDQDVEIAQAGAAAAEAS
jgi:glc operon protein GlcG